MKSGQRGFTLMELMITVAIIGILAAIALSSYQDYTIRSKISGVLLAASICRTRVTELYSIGGSTSPGAGNWGCGKSATSNLVSDVDINSNGGIQITIASGGLDPAVDGDTVLLIPINSLGNAIAWGDAGGITGWDCGPGTIQGKYLPSTCRFPGLIF